MEEPRELFLQHLPTTDRIIRSICRRNGMDAGETEEFAAEVKYRLIADDYAIIRKFQGRSSFPTYLAAVVRRLLLDYHNHVWGKWHDAAEVERLGDLAVELARLVQRDGRTIEEAFAILAVKHQGLTLEEVTDLAERLPARVRRKRVDVEEANEIRIPEGEDAIRDDTARRISVVVCKCIDTLAQEDQLILKLRFESELTVAQISRSLQIDQQLLYRRLYKLFADLRQDLRRAGFAHRDIESLIGHDTADLDFQLKNRGVRPSEETESAVAARQEEEIS